MKFRKSNFVAQSRALSKNEILDLVTGLRTDPRWRSRTKRSEHDVHSFYYPRLVDLRYLSLRYPQKPEFDHIFSVSNGGLLGLSLDQVNLQNWNPKLGESALVSGSLAFSSAETFSVAPADRSEKTIRFGFCYTGRWFIVVSSFNWFVGDDEKLKSLLQKLLDAADYSGMLEVARVVNCHYSTKAKGFIVRRSDPNIKVFCLSSEDAEETTKTDRYIQLGYFSVEDYECYGKLSADESPGQRMYVGGLSFEQAIDLLNKWHLLIFGDESAAFSVRASSDWNVVMNWLSARMSGPWVLSELFSHRSLVEDLSEPFEKIEQRDCLVPLAYWKTKAGPTLLLDSVSNGDGEWEIWVHCKKSLGNKVVDSIRQELSTESLFSGFFEEFREFKWGGSCDFIIAI